MKNIYEKLQEKVNAEKINTESKNIVVERLSEGNAYITVKDHKGEFPEKTLFRLLNTSKSEI